MTEKVSQKQYWDGCAGVKVFTHEPDMELLLPYLKPSSKILDVGCGTGRLTQRFYDQGFRDVEGVDLSTSMIALAKEQNPRIAYSAFNGEDLPFEPESFDLVLSFAVLNCIVSNEARQQHIDEISRVLKPSGLLYLSDIPLQNDVRNQSRYNTYRQVYGEFGIFELEEGAILRHANPEDFFQMVRSFKRLDFKEREAKSMNGNRYSLFQYLGQKS